MKLTIAGPARIKSYNFQQVGTQSNGIKLYGILTFDGGAVKVNNSWQNQELDIPFEHINYNEGKIKFLSENFKPGATFIVSGVLQMIQLDGNQGGIGISINDLGYGMKQLTGNNNNFQQNQGNGNGNSNNGNVNGNGNQGGFMGGFAQGQGGMAAQGNPQGQGNFQVQGNHQAQGNFQAQGNQQGQGNFQNQAQGQNQAGGFPMPGQGGYQAQGQGNFNQAQGNDAGFPMPNGGAEAQPNVNPSGIPDEEFPF